MTPTDFQRLPSRELTPQPYSQGAEKDVIILSCVRSSYSNFLNSSQRLCVALTRAKHHLIAMFNVANFERQVCDPRA